MGGHEVMKSSELSRCSSLERQWRLDPVSETEWALELFHQNIAHSLVLFSSLVDLCLRGSSFFSELLVSHDTEMYLDH